MDVRCSLKSFATSIMTSQHHSDSAIPLISQKSTPTFEAYQCKVAPTCPSTAYQGAKTHSIYMKWMWDAVYGALKPQP